MLSFMNLLSEDLHWFFISLSDRPPQERTANPEPLIAERPAGVICAVAWNKCFG